MSRLPALAVAVALGVGCGYACLGVLSMVGTNVLGFRLWWLEVLVALAAGVGTYAAFSGAERRQGSQPRGDRGTRAVWRLAFRKGFELSLEQIVAETLLDEGAALAALRELEASGQAQALPETNRWRLIRP
jgi:hypothetical protein